jgi:hypothetical protein
MPMLKMKVVVVAGYNRSHWSCRYGHWRNQIHRFGCWGSKIGHSDEVQMSHGGSWVEIPNLWG